MRHLAFLLLLGTSAIVLAGDQSAGLVCYLGVKESLAHPVPESPYLKLRKQNGIVQAVGPAALKEVLKPRVFELQGSIQGTCRTGDTTILLFQRADGETQEVETKTIPDWLGQCSAPVRLLVRCFRPEKGAALRTLLLDAAPELDVLPVEEAYWRELAEKRKAEDAAKPSRVPSTKIRGYSAGSGLYGPIGGGSRHATTHWDWILPPNEAIPRYASFIRGRNARLDSAKATQIAQAVVGFSLRYNVDARLVMAMLIVESDFDPNAVSRSGAIGLGQLMPGTARWMGVQNSYDTTDNLYGMVKLLRTHMDQFRTNELDPVVLAAYNAGEGAVRRHGGVPPYRETQAYVRRVISIYEHICGR